ncbi:response regulator [Paenibacillus filicis]|uniref:Response regulator n=1 Tax=Paenibacillus gyeongsangnamensis TaxID=3388067 RepID=A0ABT4Q7Q0_9BACL|nr:response regulator [Paenibacillus filicis]MCZ8512740.1 response regulator [Paenibacillus filicis]
MYKLLLVEDEADVRESVIQEIDWTAYGFEVVGDADNGREALELMERTVPDVVLTDIKMPFMDGLQLSEAVKERYRATKIVILTGFDEFEYAQKAIKLHIDEYVLKPFSKEELMEALAKVKAKLDQEIEQMENVHLLEEHYRKSLPVLREVFLGSLVTRKLPRAQLMEQAENYNVDLTGAGYVCAVLSLDNPSGAEEEAKSVSVSLKHSKDKDLKLFAVLNIAQEIAEQAGQRLVFLLNGQVVLLMVSDNGDRDEVMHQTVQLLEEIRQSIDKYLKFTVTIGVGTVTPEVTHVSYSYKDAVLALDYRLILDNNRIICINDVETRLVEKLRFDELKEHTLIRCIKVGSAQELKDVVDELFHGVSETPVSFKDYQIYLLEIITAILKAAKAGIGLEEVFGGDFNPFTEIYRFTNSQEAKEWIYKLCSAVMTSIASGRQSSYKTLVDQAKEFTKNHYHETDISINKVCSHLHISPGYFSSIFKKEAKTTFVGYLLHIRMEAAKELLRTTDMKAFEIAEKVGYADPNYFSFSFRKHVGVSPKEYRSGTGDG